MRSDFDCVVLGTGPPGAAAAGLIAAAGWRTLLVEPLRTPRQGPVRQFPLRQCPAQSLIPASYPLLERLGILDPLRSGRFVPKYATELVGPSGQPVEKFLCDRARMGAGLVDLQPQAWQVESGELASCLRAIAVATGCATRDTLRASEVERAGSRATGVRLAAGDGEAVEQVSCRVVLDTCGAKSLVAERFGVRRPGPGPQRMAVWGLYEKAQRASGIDGGSTLYLRTQDRRAWFWFIPLRDDRVSLGVVGSAASLAGEHAKPEAVFEEALVRCPALAERLADARLVGSFGVERALGWTASQSAGDGWLLAAGGLAGWDPLFSFGLWFGLATAELAAAAIGAALARRDCSAEALADWIGPLAPTAAALGRLVAAFATDGFCPFEFLGSFPEHRESLGDLIAGRVSDSAGRLLSDLDGWLNHDQPDGPRPKVLY